MNAQASQTWLEANQAYLIAAMDRIRAALERHVNRTGVSDGKSQIADASRGEEASDMAMVKEPISAPADDELALPYALDRLCHAFGLSDFERDLLLLCAGQELDSRFPALFALAHGDSRRAYPTISLALAALDSPHWSAVVPTEPLRHWRLIELGPSDSLVSSPLRIDEYVLHYLTGLRCFDERLSEFVEPLKADDALAFIHRDLCRQLIESWSVEHHQFNWPLVQLHGPDDASKLAIFASACAELGMQAYVMRDRDLPPIVAERRTLARLWDREAILGRSALILDCMDSDGVDFLARALSFAEQLNGLVVLTGRQPLRQQRRAVVHLEVGRPNAAEQHLLWQSGLAPLAEKLNGQLEPLANQFDLDAATIRDICADALSMRTDREPETMARALWEACRGECRPGLNDLAQRIEPSARREDLVLPEPILDRLNEIAAHVRRRNKVYGSWGFAGKGTRGLGISALFSGASGTGKTMAAEVLAGELDLDLYRIDLSSVVSKYIGESEKNLRRVFDAAEAGGAILLFDEADALFGKRTEVKDSHDRFANIEISYLLQRMEAYRGLAILTTNMKGALDNAFLRRIRFILHFPFPDAVHRAEIWGRIYPRDTPTEAVDVGKLSRLNITGGNIRNIALNAAFLAANADEPVRMSHLLRAARSEYAKLEKPLTESEISGWV